MAEIRLVKGVRLPARGLMFPGTVFEPTDDELEIIERVEANGPVVKIEPAPGQADKEITDTEEQLEHVEEVSRPKQAANLETWEGYARALGIDPKGMTKQEIISATR